MTKTTMRVLLCTVVAAMAMAEIATPTMSNPTPFANSMAQADALASSASANFLKAMPVPAPINAQMATRSDNKKNDYGAEDYEDDANSYGEKNKKKKGNKQEDKFIDELFADFDKKNKKGQNLASLLGGGEAGQLNSVVSGALQTLGLPAGSADSLLSSGSPLLQGLLSSTALPAGTGNLAGLAGTLGPLLPGLASGGDLAGLAGALGPLLPGLASGGDLAGLAGALGPLLGGSDLAGLAGSLGPLLGGSDLAGLAGSLGPLLGGSDLAGLAGSLGPLLGGSDLAGLAGSLGPLLGGSSDLAGLAGSLGPLLGGSDLAGLAGSLGGLGGLGSLAGSLGGLGSLGQLAGAAGPLLGGAGGLGSLAGAVGPLLGSLVGRDATDNEKVAAAMKLDEMARQGLIDVDSIFANLVANGIDGSQSLSLDSLDNEASSPAAPNNAALLALLQGANRPQAGASFPSVVPGSEDEDSKKPVVNQQALLSLLQGQQQKPNGRAVASTVSSSGGDNGANLVQLAQVFSSQLAQILDARRSSLAAKQKPAFAEDAKLLRSIADVLYPSKKA